LKPKGVKNKDRYVSQVLFHAGIGVAVFLFNPLAKVYFISLMLYCIWWIITCSKEKTVRAVLISCAYFTGVEVLFRMTDGGLAYEASKYLVILFMLMGMFYRGLSGKGYPYFIYLILLVPSIIVASVTLTYDAHFRTNIAFVLSGPVCLGIAALFCYDKKITHQEVIDIIKYMSLPIISTTVYIFFYNPSVKDVLYGTASNLAASGGFGPNQVSTVLGLGMFCLVVRFFLKSPTLNLKLFNLAILGIITFRAIVTFSRGGVIAAVIVIAAFLWTLFYKSSYQQRNRIIGMFVLFVAAVSITWVISSNQTRGLIDMRYANEDALGREKKDITTGRLELFMEEIDGFLSSPFLGIGASRTKNIRVETIGRQLPSHNEFGRMLSEHGILGIVVILIMFIKPLAYRTSNRKNLFFYAFFCFWFATINHSAMRIAAPAFIYALCLLNVTYDKPVVHRQLPKQ